MNIEHKEMLALEVQKFPCLFDKACANYKNRTQVDLAWAEVSNNLDIEGWLQQASTAVCSVNTDNSLSIL